MSSDKSSLLQSCITSLCSQSDSRPLCGFSGTERLDDSLYQNNECTHYPTPSLSIMSFMHELEQADANGPSTSSDESNFIPNVNTNAQPNRYQVDNLSNISSQMYLESRASVEVSSELMTGNRDDTGSTSRAELSMDGLVTLPDTTMAKIFLAATTFAKMGCVSNHLLYERFNQGLVNASTELLEANQNTFQKREITPVEEFRSSPKYQKYIQNSYFAQNVTTPQKVNNKNPIEACPNDSGSITCPICSDNLDSIDIAEHVRLELQALDTTCQNRSMAKKFASISNKKARISWNYESIEQVCSNQRYYTFLQLKRNRQTRTINFENKLHEVSPFKREHYGFTDSNDLQGKKTK